MTVTVDLGQAEGALTHSVVAVEVAFDVLMVSGADAVSYLQGQLSQNVESLAIGSTAWSFLLQPQGKVDAWGRIHRLDETTVLFVTDPGAGEAARQRLERFKLRVDVEIALVTAPALALRGSQADWQDDGQPGGVLIDAGWGQHWGVDLLGLDGNRPEPQPESGLVIGPRELLTVLRCLDGRPAMGAELTDQVIPAAARVVNRSADFTKGCYVGQELVARVDSRGRNTPTRLCRLEAGSEPLVIGQNLLFDGQPVGQVTTAIMSPTWGSLGLAMVARKVDSPAVVSSESGADVSLVEVVDSVSQP